MNVTYLNDEDFKAEVEKQKERRRHAATPDPKSAYVRRRLRRPTLSGSASGDSDATDLIVIVLYLVAARRAG